VGLGFSLGKSLGHTVSYVAATLRVVFYWSPKRMPSHGLSLLLFAPYLQGAMAMAMVGDVTAFNVFSFSSVKYHSQEFWPYIS